MTYCLNKKSPISHKESRLLQLLARALPCLTQPVVLKWSVTQVRGCGPGAASPPMPAAWQVATSSLWGQRAESKPPPSPERLPTEGGEKEHGSFSNQNDTKMARVTGNRSEVTERGRERVTLGLGDGPCPLGRQCQAFPSSVRFQRPQDPGGTPLRVGLGGGLLEEAGTLGKGRKSLHVSSSQGSESSEGSASSGISGPAGNQVWASSSGFPAPPPQPCSRRRPLV